MTFSNLTPSQPPDDWQRRTIGDMMEDVSKQWIKRRLERASPVFTRSVKTFYLAATFEDRAYARLFQAALENQGFIATSRWVDADDEQEGIVDGKLPAEALRFARTDKEDIERADALVYLSGERDSPGKSYEAGYAERGGIPVYPVGRRTPATVFYSDWRPLVSPEEFLANPFPE